MIYKKLGSTEELLPRIGLGTCISKITIEKNYKNLEKIIYECSEDNLGFIDTAPIYGNGESEIAVGNAINKINKKIFVATKISPENLNYKNVIQSCEESLKRLKVDTIDLLQIHWPNLNVPIEETLSAMKKLVENGKIKYIGVSNFSLRQLQDACKYTDIKIVSNQVEYNMLDRLIENSLLPFCEINNISVISYSPLIQGRLVNGAEQFKNIEKIANKYEMTSSQLILYWLSQKTFVIPNSSSKQKIIENLNTFKYNIAEEDLIKISEHIRSPIVEIDPKQIRVSNGYNRRVYSKIEEALNNHLNLTPSPIQLSEEIKNGDILKPIRLKENKNLKKNLKYDLVEGRLRYWAHVICFGWDKKIPCLIWRE